MVQSTMHESEEQGHIPPQNSHNMVDGDRPGRTFSEVTLGLEEILYELHINGRGNSSS